MNTRRWALTLLLMGCGALTAPLPPEGAVPMAPLPGWATLYTEVWERCGSTVRQTPAYRFEDLEFFVAPGASLRWNGDLSLGLRTGPRLYFPAELLHWDPVVRHEMLHAQIDRRGHPPIFYLCPGVA